VQEKEAELDPIQLDEFYFEKNQIEILTGMDRIIKTGTTYLLKIHCFKKTNVTLVLF
jgi:hypothetical protein